MISKDNTTQNGEAVDDEARRATTAAHVEDDEPRPFEPAPSSRRGLSLGQKLGAGLVAVLSLALIVTSFIFLLPASPEASQQPESSDVSTPPDATPASVDEAKTVEAPDADMSTSAEESVDSAMQTEDGQGEQGGSQQAAPPESSTPTGDQVPAQQPESATVSVSVSISSQAVGNPVSGGTFSSFDQGATAYDALMACGLSVNASSSQYGVYVSAIGGLAEKEHGGQSGWLYSVNGATPGVSCSSYVLHDGDSVQWYYTI